MNQNSRPSNQNQLSTSKTPSVSSVSAPTCLALHQHQQYLQLLIYKLQTQLQHAVESYWTTLSLHQQQKQQLFAHSYYLNELIGYLKEQYSLALHYESYLKDFEPDEQFTKRVFFNYLKDENLKAKCRSQLQQQLYRTLWLKHLQYLKRQYLRNNSIHAETISYIEDNQRLKQSTSKNPQQLLQSYEKEINHYEQDKYCSQDDEIVAGMR